MKITIMIGGLTGGGAERVVCNLANYLSANEHDVAIVTISETKSAYELDNRIKRKPLLSINERSNKIFDFARRYFRLRNIIKTEPSDCFVVFLPRTTALLLHFRKLIKAPVIASERCDPKVYPELTQKMLKKYAPRADAWVFQTEEAASWYEGVAKKSVVIPNAINPAFIRKPYDGEKEKCIVAAGRLSEQKNFKLLIDAFSLISEEFSDYSLKIYGKGPLEEELREYAKSKRLEARVKFMGYVDDMPEQLEKATAFVLSSDFEGMPNALMEAMALGLPCVSTDCPCGGPSYLITSGENGILVPVGDAEEMAIAIRKILSNPEMANTLSNNARQIRDRLAPEKIYKEWETQILNTVKEYNKCQD